jgi:hypothetical protein
MRCHICNEPFGPRGLPIHMAMRHGIRSQHGKGRLTDRMREAIRTGPDLLALQYPWPIEFGSREAAGWNRAFETMRAALAATPSGGSLDVERLDAAIARFYGRSLPYSTAEGIAREYEEGMDRARLNAPDAATPSEEATGLDVDVLARALAHDADAEPDEPVRLWDILSDRRRDDYRELAHRIAAEYARLTEDAG